MKNKSIHGFKPCINANGFLQLVVFASITLFSSISPQIFAVQDDFDPLPKYSTVDALGVNVYGNQVQPQLDTLSIGGTMGLSHSITVQGNTFSYNRWYGYRDKYAGGLRKTNLGLFKLEKNDVGFQDAEHVWVLTATAMGDSEQFVFKCNGTFADYPDNTCTAQQKITQGYYEALSDARHTLTNKNGHVVWTKPNGTEVDYGLGTLTRELQTSGNYKVIQPNGFTIEVSSASVTTNTGFQLKYDYVTEAPLLDAAKRGLNPNAEPQETLITSADWLSKNPKYVHGINTAYEYCNSKAPCILNYSWPKATFEWPGGMPRALYVGTSVFRVIDATGGVTEYTYEAHDAAVYDGHLLDKYKSKPNTYMVPRLAAIKPVGAKLPKIFYEYDTVISYSTPGEINSAFINTAQKPSRLTKAYALIGFADYQESPNSHAGIAYNSLFPGHSIQVQTEGGGSPIIESISLGDGERTLSFESGHGQQRNFLEADLQASGSSKSFQYDFNNISSVTDLATGTHSYGGYPLNEENKPSCINPTPARNRKTCNKPGWIKDSKGNTTYYTYRETGQVQTITAPPNHQGISAVIRYGYEELFAHYIQTPNGSKTKASTGIWLNTSEKTCIKTATVGDGCAGGANDEIVKTFEYEHDNLMLTGATITAYDKKINRPNTKRVCYQYDRYGNKTSESTPKAGLSRCAQ